MVIIDYQLALLYYIGMDICYRCHQPITSGSTRVQTDRGWYHHSTEVQGYYGAGRMGCPVPDSYIDNLKVAMEQGFVPSFCRTHYNKHSLELNYSL